MRCMEVAKVRVPPVRLLVSRHTEFHQDYIFVPLVHALMNIDPVHFDS